MKSYSEYTKSLILVSGMALLFACGKSSETATTTDKKVVLDSLKKQQVLIAEQIKTLEDQLSASGQLEAPAAKAKMVSIDTLQLRTFNHYVEVQGIVETDNNVSISSESAGNIKRMLVKRGDKVNKGQALAEIDATLIKKAIEQLQTNLDLAVTVFQKQEKLWKDNVGTEMQYLQAKAAKEGLEGQMETLQEQLRKTVIRAPFEGFIEDLKSKEGELVGPGSPVFKLVNYKGYKVVAELAEGYVSKVNVGDEVSIQFPDANLTSKATISAIGNAINTVNRTFRVDIKVDNLASSIKPNMVAYLKIRDFSKSKSIVVPLNTIQNTRDSKFVYVAENGKATRKTVVVGDTFGSEAWITSGLEPGAVLITFGYNDLTEGQEIKF